MSDSTKPKLFQHTEAFYNLLLENAVRSDSGELIFEGHTVELAQSINIAGPTYANVMRVLKSLGSIEQIQRGSRLALSRISILDPPTLDEFSTLTHTDGVPTARTLNKRLTVIEQDIANLKLSVGDVNVQEALIGLSRTVQELTDAVGLQQGGRKRNQS